MLLGMYFLSSRYRNWFAETRGFKMSHLKYTDYRVAIENSGDSMTQFFSLKIRTNLYQCNGSKKMLTQRLPLTTARWPGLWWIIGNVQVRM